MLRLAIAVGIVATIFLHSPERHPDSLPSGMAGLAERAGGELLAAAAHGPLARSIAESALRRTLSDAPPPPPPRRDDRAAVPARP